MSDVNIAVTIFHVCFIELADKCFTHGMGTCDIKQLAY